MEPAALFGDDLACAAAAAVAAAPALRTIAPDAVAARCLSPRMYTDRELEQARADLLAMLQNDDDVPSDTSDIFADPITACPLLSDDALASMPADDDLLLFLDLPAADTDDAPNSTAALVNEQLTISAAPASIIPLST